ncbi:MAG TPA: hypothetical protein PKX99_01605 [Thermoanaerobaculia bacterium]|nr:hypothetical protein [Thermoanaerobaculia bacterium]
MARRLFAFALVAALAGAGAASFVPAAHAAGSPGACCPLGDACCPRTGPDAAHGAGSCPASPAWSVTLGCCQPVPAAPAAPAPAVGGPLPNGDAGAPAVVHEPSAAVVSPARCPVPGPEAPRTAALHGLGLFTLFAVLLI